MEDRGKDRKSQGQNKRYIWRDRDSNIHKDGERKRERRKDTNQIQKERHIHGSKLEGQEGKERENKKGNHEIEREKKKKHTPIVCEREIV